MRKTLLIIAAVAMLGILATYTMPASSSKANQQVVSTNNAPRLVASNSPAADTTTTTLAPATKTSASYKDGTYTGQTDTNEYEDVSVSVVIVNGKITESTLSVSAAEPRSESIVNYAAPRLVASTKSAQSSKISTISGATATSTSYIRSLQSALDQAVVN